MEFSYYGNMVPSYNRSKPKYMAWMKAVLQPMMDIINCAQSFQRAFSVEEAVGKQLDIIGQIVGVGRQLPFTPSEDSRILNDTDYRKLLRATIAQNTWDGTNESLPYLLDTSFPELGIVIRDNQDMTMRAIVRGSFTTLQLEMLNGDLLIPRPAGVGMTYEVPSSIKTTQLYPHGGIFKSETQEIEEG